MIKDIVFETYLNISRKKFQIFVFDNKRSKILYNQEEKIYNEFKFQNLSELSKFLDKNIYKIEKLVGNFIKNIILIIEDDSNSYISLGVKKKVYDSSINQKFLENSLIELKDIFKENHQKQNILHMVIINYIVNGKNYSSFVDGLIGDYLCLEVNFISISNIQSIVFHNLLEKYQIKISQFLCGKYVKKFLTEENKELPEIAYKLRKGYNLNEIILIPKNIENKGFFEKFFQLFS